LKEVDAGGVQNGELGRRLDPFGQNPNTEIAGYPDNAGQDDLTGRTLVNVADQIHVDLDQVGLEFGEEVQTGVAGTEIVDSRDEALPLVLADNPLDVAHVIDLFPLGELEHDVLTGKVGLSRGRQRGPQAGGRLIDGVGHEVDGKLDVLAPRVKPRGGLDCLDAAGLVELVTVVGVDLGEDRPGRLTTRPAHQSFVAPDALRPGIHDGLKRHAEIKREFCAVVAADTGLRFGHLLPPNLVGRIVRDKPFPDGLA
jgi:hypothetical protein